MDIIALIPARGGSKGIPRKNIAPLAGKPLIYYTIKCAQDADCFDKILVSTDDDEIENISVEYGAEIIRRPKSISKDTSPSTSVIAHAVEVLYKNQYRPNIVCMLNPTSPLRNPNDILSTLDLIIKKKADSAFSVTATYGFFWKFFKAYDMKHYAICLSHDIKKTRPRRQEFCNFYKEAGGIYAMKVKGFLQSKRLFFKRILMHPIPNERSVDIDYMLDLQCAEYLMKNKKSF